MTDQYPPPFSDQNSQALESSPVLTPSLTQRLRALTPARVGLRRVGISQATHDLLNFQLAHGRARDAVHAPLQPASLLAETLTLRPEEKPVLLHSAAPDRNTYLQRPDLGRKLNEASRERLQYLGSKPTDLAIVMIDGLSAIAIERHAIPLLAVLLPTLLKSSAGLTLAPICLVEQGRVAIGDEIAHALSSRLVVVLIGERPGLSSPDSLGAYITWQPRPGFTTDAERNCISNIRTEGLSYREAADRLAFYVHHALDRQTTGIALKDPDSTHQSVQLHSGESA